MEYSVISTCDAFRITRDCPRFKDELDLMKFICKDFWMSLYKKQVDNLRTNHQVCVFMTKALNVEQFNSHGMLLTVMLHRELIWHSAQMVTTVHRD